MTDEEKRICKEIEKRIQYQLNHTWAGVIDSVQKDNFLNNFSGEDKVVGLILLDILLFHNQAQEKQLIRSLMRRLYANVYKNICSAQDQYDDEIERILAKEMLDACFIPVIDKNPADGSNSWTSIIRDQVGTSDCFYDVGKIPLLTSIKKRHFIFFDDMIGTGEQFSRFFGKKRYELNSRDKVSIWEIIKNSDAKVYYLCLAGHNDGIKKIKEDFPGINIIVSEHFEEDDSLLSEKNEYWAYYSDEFRDHIIKRMKSIIIDIGIEEPFTKNIAIMFERNRPSNTLFPLYWYNDNQWIPIKAREGI